MKQCMSLILLSLFFIAIQAVHSKPIEFIVDDERNNVSFTSDAPIELIVGRTPKITGKIIIDDSLDLKKLAPKANFEVDLASIDTGIPLRNEHMRDNFLETKKFPKAVLNVKEIIPQTPTKLEDGKSFKLMTKGDFVLHGVTVKKNIPVKLVYFKESEFTHSRFEKGDVIRIQSTFEVPLAEHKIQRPEVIFQKLTDTVVVTVDAYANKKN